MKKLLLLSSLAILSSCGSYFAPIEKQTVTYSGQYDGGDKSAGIVNMSFNFNPLTEIPHINVEADKEYASQICRNWGYSGNARFLGGDTTSRCIQFNSNGNCILANLPYKLVCE